MSHNNSEQSPIVSKVRAKAAESRLKKEQERDKNERLVKSTKKLLKELNKEIVFRPVTNQDFSTVLESLLVVIKQLDLAC